MNQTNVVMALWGRGATSRPWAAKWRQHAEAKAALEEARAGGTKGQISELERALKRLERMSSLRMQAVPELREEGERLLAVLRAKEQPSRPHLQA